MKSQRIILDCIQTKIIYFASGEKMKNSLFCIVLLNVLTVSSCVTNRYAQVRPDQMLPNNGEIELTLNNQYIILGKITGGLDKMDIAQRESMYARASSIDAESFKEALTSALSAVAPSGANQPVNDQNVYRLEVHIKQQSHETLAPITSVILVVNYQLWSQQNNNMVFETTIRSPYLAVMDTESKTYWNRARDGYEGATRRNIGKFIDSINTFF